MKTLDVGIDLSKAQDPWEMFAMILKAEPYLERLRSDQQIAVATIAGNLISAMLANPKYWQDYQSLQSDAMRTILNLSMSTFEFERRISEIDKQKMEMDVFAYDGRRQFIELAWDIYQETGRQNPNRE